MFVRRRANNHQGINVWKKRRSSPPLPSFPPSPRNGSPPAPSSDEGEGVLGGVLGAVNVAAVAWPPFYVPVSNRLRARLTSSHGGRCTWRGASRVYALTAFRSSIYQKFHRVDARYTRVDWPRRLSFCFSPLRIRNEQIYEFSFESKPSLWTEIDRCRNLVVFDLFIL